MSNKVKQIDLLNRNSLIILGKKLQIPGYTNSFTKPYRNMEFLRGAIIDAIKNQLEKLDETFNLSSNGNAEILCVWFLIAIKADYRPAFDSMKTFLTKIGRRKFLQPIYEELAKNPANKKWAKEVYEKARDNYHYVSFNTIDGILND